MTAAKASRHARRSGAYAILVLAAALGGCTSDAVIGSVPTANAVSTATYSLAASEIVLAPIETTADGDLMLSLKPETIQCAPTNLCLRTLGAAVLWVDAGKPQVVISTLPADGQSVGWKTPVPLVAHHSNSTRLAEFRFAGSSTRTVEASSAELAPPGTPVLPELKEPTSNLTIDVPIRLPLTDALTGTPVRIPTAPELAVTIAVQDDARRWTQSDAILNESPSRFAALPISACRPARLEIRSDLDPTRVHAAYDIVVSDPRFVQMVPVGQSDVVVSDGACRVEVIAQ